MFKIQVILGFRVSMLIMQVIHNLKTTNKDLIELSQSIISYDEGASTRNTIEGNLVRDILYSSRENVNFVHEVYRQAFLLSFRYIELSCR